MYASNSMVAHITDAKVESQHGLSCHSPEAVTESSFTFMFSNAFAKVHLKHNNYAFFTLLHASHQLYM